MKIRIDSNGVTPPIVDHNTVDLLQKYFDARDECELDPENEEACSLVEELGKDIEISEEVLIGAFKVVDSVPFLDDIKGFRDKYVLIYSPHDYSVYAIRLSSSDVITYLLFQIYAGYLSPGVGCHRIVLDALDNHESVVILLREVYGDVRYANYVIPSGRGTLIEYSLEDKTEYALVFTPNSREYTVVFSDRDVADVIYAIASTVLKFEDADEIAEELEDRLGITSDEAVTAAIEIGKKYITMT